MTILKLHYKCLFSIFCVLIIATAALSGCGGAETGATGGGNGGGTKGNGGTNQKFAECKSTYGNFVETSLENADVIAGGKLYDKWWVEATSTSAKVPTETIPFWDTRTNPSINTRTGADTWRCKECHGWDYKGADGVYGDTSNNHYTGFPGVFDAKSKDPIDVYCSIRAGTTTLPEHTFTGTGFLHNLDILDLTRFITESNDQLLELIDLDQYIDKDTATPIAASSTNGNELYANKGIDSCSGSTCHGSDGTFQNEWLGDLAADNPWEFIHKVRFGHAGNSRMPAYADSQTDYSAQDAADLTLYAQQSLTKSSGGEQECTASFGTFVTNNIGSADPVLGAKLYDKWWVESTNTGVITPTTTISFWDTRDGTINARTGADTWRCKECHGWDYKGVDGVYGDQSNNHYTGFPGVLTAKSKAPLTVFCAIYDGTATQPGHAFAGKELLNDDDILNLAKFITESSILFGLIQTNDYINPETGVPVNADASLGGTMYSTNGGGCADQTCHGVNGDVQEEFIGVLAEENPWETMHKIRFGHAGNTRMPSYSMAPFSYTPINAKNIIKFAQDSLTTTPPPPPEPPGAPISGNTVRGGQLFDKWWVVLGMAKPININPLFTYLQNKQSPDAPTKIVTPADPSSTWRCKQCHGWDYAGVNGAYGAVGNSNYTGVKGLLSASTNISAERIAAIITNSQLGLHKWDSFLSAADIQDLVKFIKEGMEDTNPLIAGTKLVKIADVDNGLDIYATRPSGAFAGLCINCHGADAKQAPPNGAAVDLPVLALDNPWEVLHKTRFGQPGTAMPALYRDTNLVLQDSVDVLGYLQSLGLQ